MSNPIENNYLRLIHSSLEDITDLIGLIQFSIKKIIESREHEGHVIPHSIKVEPKEEFEGHDEEIVENE